MSALLSLEGVCRTYRRGGLFYTFERLPKATPS